MNVDSLSPAQRDALAQLQALTNGGDAEVSIGVLASVDWDVQRAAEIVFDGVPSPIPRPAAAPEATTRIEQFEIDDSEQDGLLGGRGARREFRPVRESGSLSAIVIRPLRVIFNILAIPLYPIFSLLRFLFRALRIPLPNFGLFTFSYRPSGPGGSREARDPKSVAARWVRALEEETGAICASRKHSQGNGHGVASGVAGSSTLTARGNAWQEGSNGSVENDKLLPDFFLGAYEEFARTCQRELRIGCVVIVSDEHDDDAEFKRSTLTDPSFLRVIQENEILVWGGDIRDREAWSASQKLQATTYPFVAFIALQPRRAPGSSSAPAPTMTILSRHQGTSIPSTSAPTAAQTLVTHLKEQLFPRVTPFLNKLRVEAAERERERALRAEQDLAFEAARRKDTDRILQKRAADAAAAEEKQRAAKAEARAVEDERKAAESRKQWDARRMEWRRWLRRGLVLREPRPGENGRGKTMRVGVRLPDGRRSVRFFGESDPLTALYAYVDSLLIPPEFVQDADPMSAPEGGKAGEEGVVLDMQASGRSPEKWWGFKLVLAYPRREIPWEAEKKVGEIEVLRGGGQVVVEFVADEDAKSRGKSRSSMEQDGDDDEYHTESD
ncbi:hypothetical protein LXA43DRAFT_1007112 [Ganoderma leucocontextum]|nr:hypothetical protein LXA43DRAFT_1007112 [Ganoderma leucocontextum]